MSHVRLLALETSTDACSVAFGDGHQLASRQVVEARAHAGAIMSMIDEVLQEAGTAVRALDGIAFGCGPGSFTGVRIAVALAQGLALGAALPVLGVSSLRALAVQAMDACDDECILVLQDARMNEVYAGCFRRGSDGLPAATMADAILPPAGLQRHDATLLVGNATAGNREVARWSASQPGLRVDESCSLPLATSVLRVAAAALPEAWQAASLASAVYLRNDVAQRPGS